MHYNFIRELVADNVVSLHHCSTDDQLADMFTKPLSSEKHVVMRSLIRVRTLQLKRGVEELIKDGEQVVNVGAHGVEDHSLTRMEKEHGAKKDGGHECRDGIVPVRDGSLKK